MEPKTLRTVIPAVLNSIRTSSTMMTVKGYTNNFGELSDFSIVFHVNYLKAVKRSLDIWYSYRPLDALETRVRADLVDSYELTLQGPNPRALSTHAYRPITDRQALIKSVKWCDSGKSVHFWGFLAHKRLVKPGSYPSDFRGEFTRIRAKLLALTPISRFRQFVIQDGRFEKISVEKLILTEDDLYRKL